jgi:hypothetical protein
MTLWDILAIAVALALVLEGVFKGAVRLAFGLAGLILGYFFAGRIAPVLAKKMGFVPGAVRFYIAVAVGFGLVILTAVLLGYIVHRLVKAVGLSLPNRVSGAVLGLGVACYLAGGLDHYARGHSPKLSGELNRSPVFGVLARGALLLDELIGPGGGGMRMPTRPEVLEDRA